MVTSKATWAASSETIKRQCASRWQMTKLSNTSALVSRRLLRQVLASQVRASHLRRSKPPNGQSRLGKAGAGRSRSGEVAKGGVVLIRCCDLDRREQQKFRRKR